MKSLYRIVILFALLLGAVMSYVYGSKAGLFLFIALGLILELAFWLRLSSLFRKS
jgi:hypothetical protein